MKSGYSLDIFRNYEKIDKITAPVRTAQECPETQRLGKVKTALKTGISELFKLPRA